MRQQNRDLQRSVFDSSEPLVLENTLVEGKCLWPGNFGGVNHGGRRPPPPYPLGASSKYDKQSAQSDNVSYSDAAVFLAEVRAVILQVNAVTVNETLNAGIHNIVVLRCG